MASPAQCFYCFETLSASFQNRKAPSLERIQALYDQYTRDDEAEQDMQDINIEEDVVDGVDEENSENETEKPLEARLQLPSISRLQAATPSSRSSSSSAPSVSSQNSSQSHLTGPSTPSSAPETSYASKASVDALYPLFVTWNTISRSGHKSLRGCIGTFEGQPLGSGLQQYALTSAFDDTRFSPIRASLLPSLSCSLTLLANFESCKDAMDWTLGVHGLRISFTHRSRRHSATYLPDVAVEQGWTKAETIESLMRKAGWDNGHSYGVARRTLRNVGRSNSEQSPVWEEVSDFRAVRYTGLKASATYPEWMQWREWVEQHGESMEAVH